jgi:monoamine oxidase
MGEKLDPEDPSTFVDAAELDNMNLIEYSEKYLPGRVSALISNVCARGFLGVEATEISALFFIDYVRSGFRLESLLSDLKGGAQYLRARQGWQTISKSLATTLEPSTVQLSTPVTSITQTEAGCTIVSATNETFTSKRVILSVSTPLYKEITFSPPLPAKKMEIASKTHLGFTAKMILIYDSPWWRALDLSGVLNSDIGPLAFSRDSSADMDAQYSLTCFLVGDPGRAWATIPTVKEREVAFLKHIDEMFSPVVEETSKTVPQPVHTIEQIWMNEPYIWGCPCPVTALGDLAKGAAKIRREVFGKLHFIGTETSVDYQGYMEGAISSGERGSAEVIVALAN